MLVGVEMFADVDLSPPPHLFREEHREQQDTSRKGDDDGQVPSERHAEIPHASADQAETEQIDADDQQGNGAVEDVTGYEDAFSASAKDPRVSNQERRHDHNARPYGQQVHVNGPVQKPLAVVEDQHRKHAHDADRLEFHPDSRYSIRGGKSGLDVCQRYNEHGHDPDIEPVSLISEKQHLFTLDVGRI